jgi:hypothetical protein
LFVYVASAVVVDSYRCLATLVSGNLNLTPNMVIISCNNFETIIRPSDHQSIGIQNSLSFVILKEKILTLCDDDSS